MNNNQPEGENQVGEKNPTLDTPGTQVADYGNPTGGSGDDEGSLQQDRPDVDKGRIEPLKGNNETVGNP
jgi:hypothetical protein